MTNDTNQQTTKQRVRRAVSPEIAANVREEDEALAATIATAEAVANAAVAAANAAVRAAREKHTAALRPVLRQLGLEDAAVIGTEGHGARTVLVLDVVRPIARPKPTPTRPARKKKHA